MDRKLSDEEKKFILQGIIDDIRCDGRSKTCYRPIELATDVIDSANGSARVKSTKTDILVGVKTAIEEPEGNPEEGRIEFSVDCSSTCAMVSDIQNGEELCERISRSLSVAFNNICLEKLCIVPEQHCWVLYVDVLILEYEGNVIDAAALAVKAALHSTKIPLVKAVKTDGTEFDFEFSDNPNDSFSLDLTDCPSIVSLNKVGKHFLVDSTFNELRCSTGCVTVSTRNGALFSVSVEGGCSFHESTLDKAITIAISVGNELNVKLDNALKKEEEIKSIRGPCKFIY